MLIFSYLYYYLKIMYIGVVVGLLIFYGNPGRKIGFSRGKIQPLLLAVAAFRQWLNSALKSAVRAFIVVRSLRIHKNCIQSDSITLT